MEFMVKLRRSESVLELAVTQAYARAWTNREATKRVHRETSKVFISQAAKSPISRQEMPT